MSKLNYSIYVDQITVKIYELNVQNTKHLLIQQNDDLNQIPNEINIFAFYVFYIWQSTVSGVYLFKLEIY